MKIRYEVLALFVVLCVGSLWAQQPPECPFAPGVYVLQGDSWVPMLATYPKKVMPGHMKAMRGEGIIAIYRGGESIDRVPSGKPTFCVVGIDSENAVQLLSLQARAKERRVIVAKMAAWKGAFVEHERYFDPDAIIPINSVKGPQDSYTFTPQRPLPNGEYILFADLPESFPKGKFVDPRLVKGYDFGYFAR